MVRDQEQESTILNNTMVRWHGYPLLAVYTQHQPLLVQVRWCLGMGFVSAHLTSNAVLWSTIRDDTGKYFQGEGEGQRLPLCQKHCREFRYSTSGSSCVYHRRNNIRGGAFHRSDERIWARRSRDTRRNDDSQFANVFTRSHKRHEGTRVDRRRLGTRALWNYRFKRAWTRFVKMLSYLEDCFDSSFLRARLSFSRRTLMVFDAATSIALLMARCDSIVSSARFSLWVRAFSADKIRSSSCASTAAWGRVKRADVDMLPSALGSTSILLSGGTWTCLVSAISKFSFLALIWVASSSELRRSRSSILRLAEMISPLNTACCLCMSLIACSPFCICVQL